MKTKVLVMGLALAAMMFAGCKSTQKLPPPSDFIEYELPCGDFDMDTKDYFTGLGVAENLVEQNARQAALEAAKGEVRSKLGGIVKGLSTDYSKIMRGSATQTDVSSIVEGELTTAIDRVLNDPLKTCEKIGKTPQGKYKSYIAIKVSKEELAKEMASELSDNDKLRIEYDRELFRKYAEEKMKGLKEQDK